MANTKYRYIDLSFSKCPEKQIDFHFSKTIYLNGIIVRRRLYLEKDPSVPPTPYVGPYVFYCVVKYYVERNNDITFCLVSTPEYSFIQYKKDKPRILSLEEIRNIFISSINNAKALGLDNETIEYYSLSQIALASLS